MTVVFWYLSSFAVFTLLLFLGDEAMPNLSCSSLNSWAEGDSLNYFIVFAIYYFWIIKEEYYH